MGMFTYGGMNAFQNRLEKHRTSRADARKNYQEWLASMRQDGVDITEKDALTEWNAIADNNRHIRIGAPTQHQIKRQTEINNVAAARIRAEQELSHMQAIQGQTDAFQKALDDSYNRWDDTATAVKNAAKSFKSKELSNLFNEYQLTLDHGEGQKRAWGQWMTENNDHINKLAGQGVVDYSTHNPSLSSGLLALANSQLGETGDRLADEKGNNIFQTFFDGGGVVDIELLDAALQDANVTQGVSQSLMGQAKSRNQHITDDDINTYVATLFQQKENIDPEAFATIIANASDKVKLTLNQRYKQHTSNVKQLQDKETTEAINAVLISPSVQDIISNRNLTQEDRVEMIMANLSHLPDHDDMARQIITDYLEGVEGTSLSLQSKAYRLEQGQLQHKAQQQTEKLIADSDTKVKTETIAAAQKAKLNDTQMAIVHEVLQVIEPYYINASDPLVLARLSGKIVAEAKGGNADAQRIASTLVEHMITDARLRRVATSTGQLGGKQSVPVSIWMREWQSVIDQSKANIDTFWEKTNELRAFDLKGNLVSNAGAVTREGAAFLVDARFAVRNLTVMLKDIDENMRELQEDRVDTSKFFDPYTLSNKTNEIDGFLKILSSASGQANRELTALQSKLETAEGIMNVNKGSAPASQDNNGDNGNDELTPKQQHANQMQDQFTPIGKGIGSWLKKD